MTAPASGGSLRPGILLVLSACAVGPNFQRPSPPSSKSYLHERGPAALSAEGARQRFEPGTELPPEWWRLFHCARLDALVADALARNPTLEAAEAALRQSERLLQAGYGVFYPPVEVDAGASRQKFNPRSFGISQIPASAFNLFSLSAGVSYALDVFGGERRQVEALGAQRDLQRYASHAARLALAGNVVQTVAARAGYLEQVRATADLIAAESDQVKLATDQARAGVGTWLSVAGLASQLAATQATLPVLQQRIDQAEHLLATLSGRAPGEFSPPGISLGDLSLPAEVPVRLPAGLVRRRPDVLAAEAQLHAANAQIGVATAALLPRFTLTPSVGLESNEITSLFSASSVVWNLGAGLTAPLFEGGTLWFQRKAAIEARAQALATYRATVLSALQQVADSLRALEHDAQALEAEGRALRAADDGLRWARANFRAGVASYLQVLVANGQLLQARLGYAQAVSQRLQDTAALFVALGGGWK